MKNLKLYTLIIFGASLLFSCKDDDNGRKITPPRDYAEQYATESLEIEEYLKTHYINGTGLELTLEEIPENGTQTPVWENTDLTYKIVNKHNIEYKLYYIKFNEGTNQRPSHVDSIFVSYRGWLTDGTQFDYRPNSLWLPLDEVIEGWSQIFPEFKTGFYNEISNSFEDTGAGIMFIPSGLGYYNLPPSGSTISQYSTLTFTFNLNTLRYRDQDRDGIQSRFEVENLGDDPREYDSDGDGVPNYRDTDDDNDGVITRKEIERNLEGDLYSFDEIPLCNGIKVHLNPEPGCIGPILEP